MGRPMPSKSDMPGSKLDDSSRRALRFISEQASVRVDQLARYLGLNPAKTEDLVRKLEAVPLVLSKVFFDDEPRWLWLNRRGAALAETGLAHRCYPPDLIHLGHRFAVNEVRLHLEEREPNGTWLSETTIQGRRPRGAQIPDGVFEVGTERHAIEVELSPKDKSHLGRVLAENSDRYDAVVYFCGFKTIRMLRGYEEGGDWPKLIVRKVPSEMRERSARRVRRDAKRVPTPEEASVLRLIAEQGAIRVDQLGRFLSLGTQEVDQLLTALAQANFLKVEPGLKGEPDWLTVTFAATRLCGSPLEYFRPGIGLINEWFAMNELRLFFAARAPAATWTSRRLLKKQHGKNAPVPHALVEVEGKRLGINLRQSATNAATLVPRTDIQNLGHDALLFFCVTPRARLFMERLQDKQRWSNVVIRDMPKPENFTRRPSEAEQLVESS
jgi:DNA-binding MarR family transcriptional regulator